MKNILIILSVILLGIYLPGCKKIEGKGPIVTQKVNLPAFNIIHSNIAANVYVSKGPIQEVNVEGQQNLIDELDFSVSGNIVTIKNKEKIKIINWSSVNIYITIPEWLGFELKGSGNISTDNYFVSPNFTSAISGSGSANLYEITADAIDVEINGSGDLKSKAIFAKTMNTTISGSGSVKIADGTSSKMNLLIKGSGSFNFDNKFTADSAFVKISGSGDAAVHVVDYLNVKISGSGNLTYFGKPIIDVDISGSGKVKNGQ